MNAININEKHILKRINRGRSTDKLLVKLENAQEYVFKYNKESNGTELYLIELIVSKLLAKINYPNFVEYRLAKFNNIIGNLSVNFIDKYAKEITLRDIQYINHKNENNTNFVKLEHKTLSQEQIKNLYKDLREEKSSSFYFNSIGSVINDVRILCKNYNININENELYNELLYMAIVDYFLGNGDRQWENIDFLITDTKNQKHLNLAPNFDYEYFFNMYCYETLLQIKNSKDFIDEFNNDKFYYRILFGISDISSNDFNEKNKIITEFKKYRNTISDQEKSYFDKYSNDNAKLIVLDILENSKNNKKIKELVNSIQKINMQDIFKEIESENQIQIPNAMKEIIIDVFSDRKNLYCSLNEFIENKNKVCEIEYFSR